MRKFAGFATLFAIALLASLASAQQGDVALGFGTVMAPGSAACNLVTGCPEKGGLYPAVSADVIFHRRIGFGYEVTWRGGVGAYGGSGGQPYRPIINDFNAVYQPRLGKKVGADLLGGIGFQDTRYYQYQNTANCVYFGACFSSSHHFLVDVGGGLRYYFWHHVFVRPEAHYYWIRNNTVDFNSNNILRVGASIGYTIGGPE
ncbi:conserved exported hypothetical protein [Candidatus Sulfotelmatobacter kueseliae]|uniref:Outer membrane protein beta-barrel domain-containing protein n=1 Tax=Candidatus Sulfotelmatobacter kueseliae TaxID=2042962 RepID=A0A2U3KI44_9BACT|nr:conserved exported hypothetical protein [Candidatus Sulfotelmatobacter kueseliae]